MAGWTCPDKALIRWDGTIESTDGFIGDGSRLTNVGIGAEADPIFQAASAAYNTHLASAAIHFSISEGSNITFNKVGTNVEIAATGGGGGTGGLWTSGAEFIYPIVGSQIVSGAGFITAGVVSGANITILQASGAQAAIDHKSLSGAYTTHAANTNIHYASTALWTAINKNTTNTASTSSAYLTHAASTAIHFVNTGFLTSETDPIWSASSAEVTTNHKVLSSAYTAHAANTNIHYASTALWTAINKTTTNAASTSSAYLAHAASSSNPHGAYLTQTSFAVVGDHTTSAAGYCVNVIMASTATPPTASTYPQGTIFLQYTA